MAVSTTVLWMSCSEGENTASHLCFFTETINFTSKQGSNRNEYRASPHFDCVTRLLSNPPRQSTVDCLVHTINCRWRIFSEHLNNTKSFCNLFKATLPSERAGRSPGCVRWGWSQRWTCWAAQPGRLGGWWSRSPNPLRSHQRIYEVNAMRF